MTKIKKKVGDTRERWKPMIKKNTRNHNWIINALACVFTLQKWAKSHEQKLHVYVNWIECFKGHCGILPCLHFISHYFLMCMCVLVERRVGRSTVTVVVEVVRTIAITTTIQKTVDASIISIVKNCNLSEKNRIFKCIITWEKRWEKYSQMDNFSHIWCKRTAKK